jgi:Na+/proline symporter
MTARGRALDDRNDLWWSRIFTLLWGLALIGGAMLFADTRNPVVELGLKIASVTYGGLLGTFFLGLLSRRTTQRDAFIGFIAGILTMIVVLYWTTIDFTWHTLIGCAVTVIVGTGVSLVFPHPDGIATSPTGASHPDHER